MYSRFFFLNFFFGFVDVNDVDDIVAVVVNVDVVINVVFVVFCFFFFFFFGFYYFNSFFGGLGVLFLFVAISDKKTVRDDPFSLFSRHAIIETPSLKESFFLSPSLVIANTV